MVRRRVGLSRVGATLVAAAVVAASAWLVSPVRAAGSGDPGATSCGAAGACWSTTPSPSPSGYFDQLAGVSCVSAAFCVGVGQSANAMTSTLAEQWDGANWTVMTTPSSGQGDTGLSAVSCVSTVFCMAVGWLNGNTLASRWDGTSWSVVPTVNPQPSNLLTSVSCVSAQFCVAVGHSTSSSISYALLEEWDGTAWSVMAPAAPTAASGYLTGVSCTSATFCAAVGTTQATIHDSYRMDGELWNGTVWSSTAPPPSLTGDPTVPAVSCASPTFCVAPADQYGTGPVIVRWDGRAWTVIQQGANRSHTFSSVSCPSSTFCVAVGIASNSPVANGVALPDAAIAQEWNGSSWGDMVTTPDAQQSTTFDAASCPSVNFCMAAGYAGPSGNTYRSTFAEQWSGSGSTPPIGLPPPL